MTCKNSFPANALSVDKISAFVGGSLEKGKIKHKVILKEKIRTEEIAEKLIKFSDDNSEISVFVSVLFGRYEIRLSCKGKEFSAAEFQGEYQKLLGDDEDVNGFIRRFCAKIVGEDIKLKNKNGVNICSFRNEIKKRSQLVNTFIGLLLGVIFGFVLKFLIPSGVSEVISSDILGTVSTMFLNAMKMIVAPLVFFSIAASIADFGDLKTLGKIAIKVFSCYILTSVIAIAVGFGTYSLMPIGDTSLASLVGGDAAATVEQSQEVSISVKDTIMGIIPSDIVTPFLESDMLQVIFIAAIMGIAVASVSNEKNIFKNFIISGNEVFGKITAMIISFMPVAVFCSMGEMIYGIDISALASVVMWVPVCFVGCIFMMCVYGLLILVLGRLNPVKFFKAFAPASLTAFSIGSSNATIPVSVRMCDERLGISKKLYSFSIPFGATVNMDGNCIVLMITALFMAKIFGITITAATVFKIAVSILLLSVGAPGVPGGCLVCIAFLIPQIGVPAEAIGIVMGLYSIASMAFTCCNVTGDAAVTTIVARTEKMIDLKKYNSN